MSVYRTIGPLVFFVGGGGGVKLNKKCKSHLHMTLAAEWDLKHNQSTNFCIKNLDYNINSRNSLSSQNFPSILVVTIRSQFVVDHVPT